MEGKFSCPNCGLSRDHETTDAAGIKTIHYYCGSTLELKRAGPGYSPKFTKKCLQKIYDPLNKRPKSV